MSLDGAATLLAVAVVPLVAMMLSAFVKTSVVLGLLRNALGAPQAPSGLVVTGLALILTAFVMAPVASQVVDAVRVVPAGVAPGGGTPGGEDGVWPRDAEGWLAAGDRAAVPVKAFLGRHAHAEDRATFLALARDLRGAGVADDDLLVLSAAFVTSELTEAFAIAFLVFLPFLILDLVVGIALGALGMQSTPTVAVSLPLKLLLFVAVDGWRLLADGLIRGYT